MQSYLDSPRYRALVAQVLQGSQRPVQSPGEAVANGVGSLADAYMLKKETQKGEARQADYGKAVAGALNNEYDYGQTPSGNTVMARLLGSGNADVTNDFAPKYAEALFNRDQQANAPIKPIEQAGIDRNKALDAESARRYQEQQDESKRRFNVGESDKLISGVDAATNQLLTHDMNVTRNAETERHNKATEGIQLKTAESKVGDPNDPAIPAHVTAILSGNETAAQVPMNLRNQVAIALANQPKASYSPIAAARLTLASERITSPFKKLPAFELTANGKPYLQRIDAALKHPGSVADQDLLDSIIKLNTSGNAITDAQSRLITDGRSWSDFAGVIKNQFQNGGVLSPNQRKQIHDLANATYDNYKKGYQPVYDQATAQLKAANIPEAFWTIPDLNKFDVADPPDSGAQAPGWRPPMANGAQPAPQQAPMTAVGPKGQRIQWNGSAWVPM